MRGFLEFSNLNRHKKPSKKMNGFFGVGLFCMLWTASLTHAGQIANVDFVHRYITQKWGITVPIKHGNIYQAVNVKYTLCAVDKANEILNGTPPTTTYCNHPLATLQAIDTTKVIDAVDRLIKLDLYPGTGGEGEPFKVYLTGMGAGQQFSFVIGASGNFTVDWGDGSAVQNISKASVGNMPYSKTYSAAGNYIVTIGGQATGYSTSMNAVAISFNQSTNAAKITKISGDVGTVFPILNNTAAGKPRFWGSFQYLTGWKGSIPSNLFAGLHGEPGEQMFHQAFEECFCTGPIPEKLFAGIVGPPVPYLFGRMFINCTSLSGTIPGNLFSGISGAPVSQSFSWAFSGCTGLTGVIPGNLFSGVSGPPVSFAFTGVFSGCTGLTGIGDGLFNGITGSMQANMFPWTFQGCSGLTGPSAKSGGQFLYQKWPSATANEVMGCYEGATGLSDYASIPAAWK